MPQAVSRVRGTCAEDIAGFLPSGDFVVDFQTETSNFFAGEILVHNCLIIDDSLKSAEQADSVDARDTLWSWYGSTAYTRLAPGGGVLVIQTWWSDDDLAGRLQNAMAADPEADQFEVVKYPAISIDDEFLDLATDAIVLGRDIIDEPPENYRPLRLKGEALHPARYDLRKLLQIKNTLQPRHWSALYQQNPVPEDGEYFTKDQFRRRSPPTVAGHHVVIAWDFAISEKKQNDFTVGTVALQDSDDVLHVVDQVRFKSGDAHFIVEAILNLSAKWYSPGQLLGFEDGQIFKAISSLLKKRMRERKQYIPFVTLTPITDKMARARPLQGRMQQGMVTFSDQGDWYDNTRAEMLRFPAGVHDDCVDSLAWLVVLALGKAPPRVVKPKGQKSWKDRLTGAGVGAVSHMAA